jgi:Zn-dependent protease with chaperone function
MAGQRRIEERERRFRKWKRSAAGRLSLSVVLACAPIVSAKAGLLDFASPGLAWSATAVRTASERVADVEQTTRNRIARDCLTHCVSIERAWSALLAAARAHAELDHMPDLSLVAVQHDDIEAQSLPGGQVVVGEPFIRRRGLTEPEIAFVLAHEIAHVLHQHERQLLTSALALLPRDVPRTVGDVYVEMDFNMSLLRSLEVVMYQAEFEADETAMYLTALAGYEPSDTLRFLETENAMERTTARVLSTHPSAASRLESARRSLPLALRLTEHGRQQRAD